MALCRWSSMNWKCDLYCYYDCYGGITIHVAARRRVEDIPELPNVLDVSSEEWCEACKKQLKALKEAKLVEIGLPADGKTFWCSDIKTFHDKLRELKEMGYRFPEDLFEIDEEPESIKEIDDILQSLDNHS